MEKKIEGVIYEIGNIVDLWLPHKILYDFTAGMTVGIGHEGNLVYKNSFGFAEKETNRLMKHDDIFRVASISKLFTAVAILQLQERGQLRLDDKISDYLSWFKGSNNIADLKEVTIRHILSHTGGIFRDGIDSPWIKKSFPEKIDDTFSDTSPVFDNLTQFKYSNHGFAVLGMIVEKIVGQKYSEYVTKNIIEPIKLSHTYPDLDEEVAEKLVFGYGRLIPGQKEIEKFEHIPTKSYAPAGGFISNISDLTLFLNALRPQHPDSELLTKSSRKEMIHPYSDPKEDGVMYGLGCQIDEVCGKKVIGHSGGFPGYLTNGIIEPESGISVCVFSNSLNSSSYNISFSIMRALLNWKDDYTLDKKCAFNPERYVGLYRNFWGDTIIAKKEDYLIAFGSQTVNPFKNPAKLTYKKEDSFVIKEDSNFDSVGEDAVFTEEKDGKMQKLMWGPAPSTRV